MTAKIVIFFAVRKERSMERTPCRSQAPIMKKPFLSKGLCLPALHSRGGHRHPVDSSGAVWNVATDFLETPPAKQLALPRNMPLPFKAVRFRAIPFFPENRSGHT